jgi:hypothetical protein
MSAMRQKIKTSEGKKICQKRMYTVEPDFGNIQGDIRIAGIVNLRTLNRSGLEWS